MYLLQKTCGRRVEKQKINKQIKIEKKCIIKKTSVLNLVSRYISFSKK